MQQIINEISFIYPNEIKIDKLRLLSASEIFSEESIDFLSDLSKEISRNPLSRNFPDVITFAFFCRKANILSLKQYYENDLYLRFGRGIVFHIAPSNVPVNFAYSLLCGVLSGNSNIIRIPSKDFIQVEIIVEAIKKLAEKIEFKKVLDRIVIVKYDKSSSATSFFSSFCDVRVIWGGDETIKQIRQSNIPVRSFDVTFADRYSICIINAKKYLEENDYEKIAHAFYNDTYLFDQNACTAPHLINWFGEKIDVQNAKKIFWKELYKVVAEKYTNFQAVIAIDKLTTFYSRTFSTSNIHKSPTPDNLLWRIEIDNLSKDIDEYRCSSGFFWEYSANSLSELTYIINKKYQTIAYYGFEKDELERFTRNEELTGIDRIVPIGKTADFSVFWDGFDLIRTLSRVIQII